MILLQCSVGSFFDEALSDLECQKDTKAYIISTFDKYKSADNNDLSQYSIAELFVKAKQTNEFAIYQNIGDWIFVCSVVFPQHLKNASKNYYDNMARLSYYACYNIIHRAWPLYEEMADRLIFLETEIAKRMPKLKSPKDF